MTKDLVLLVREGQDYLTTQEFLDKVIQNLDKKMSA